MSKCSVGQGRVDGARKNSKLSHSLSEATEVAYGAIVLGANLKKETDKLEAAAKKAARGISKKLPPAERSIQAAMAEQEAGKAKQFQVKLAKLKEAIETVATRVYDAVTAYNTGRGTPGMVHRAFQAAVEYKEFIELFKKKEQLDTDEQ